MDWHRSQPQLMTYVDQVSDQFQKIPGSAILLRYIRSSYQNDPVRSAVELFLVLFAIRYLLAPKYSTKPNLVALSEEVGVAHFQCLRTEWPMNNALRKLMTLWRNGPQSHWLGKRLLSKKQKLRKGR